MKGSSLRQEASGHICYTDQSTCRQLPKSLATNSLLPPTSVGLQKSLRFGKKRLPDHWGWENCICSKDHILPMQKLTVEAGHLKELQWQQKCRVRSSKVFLQRKCLCFPGRQLREKGGILGDMRSPVGRENPQVASTLSRMGS